MQTSLARAYLSSPRATPSKRHEGPPIIYFIRKLEIRLLNPNRPVSGSLLQTFGARKALIQTPAFCRFMAYSDSYFLQIYDLFRFLIFCRLFSGNFLRNFSINLWGHLWNGAVPGMHFSDFWDKRFLFFGIHAGVAPPSAGVGIIIIYIIYNIYNDYCWGSPTLKKFCENPTSSLPENSM